MDAYLEHGLVLDVAVAWTRDPGNGTHRVLPDGCVDILLTFDGDPSTGAVVSADVVGAMTRAVVVPPRQGSNLGLRFLPGRAGFLGIPAAELADARVPLAELGLASLAAGVDAEVTLEARLRRLAAALAPRLVRPPPHVQAAVVALATRGVRVSRLAEDLGVTRQHLARGFAAHVGLEPRQLARVMRLCRVVAAAGGARDVDWAAEAQRAGYADQSHLSRDFHRLAGTTPGRWLAGA